MKNLWIYITITVITGAAIYLFGKDFFSSRSDRSPVNPYAYEIDGFSEVDPELVRYREKSRIGISMPYPRALDWSNGLLYILYRDHLQAIDSSGIERLKMPLADTAIALGVSPYGDHEIFIAFNNYIERYDRLGHSIQQWDTIPGNPYPTSLAFTEEAVYVADAGNRIIHQYAYDGTPIKVIEGKGRIEGNYGFIIPSPYFEVLVDPYGELWAVNSGLHQFENYTDNGSLRAFWGEPSFGIAGFTGCCNPVHAAVLPDGSFVTSEKGLTRIKIHKPSGEFDCVVAPPAAFAENSEGPDIAVDSMGRIYALDYEKLMIRVFEKKETERL